MGPECQPINSKLVEEFTIAIKGVGWTQLDNTMAVTL